MREAIRNYRIVVFAVLVFLLGSANIKAQDSTKWSGALGGKYLLTGPLYVSHTVLIHGNVQYQFYQKEKIKGFVEAGVFQDVDKKVSTLFGVDLSAGIRYDLVQLAKRPFFLIGKIGGFSLHEKFATQLTDQTVINSFNTYGVVLESGVGWEVSRTLKTSLVTTQYHAEGTGVGFQLSYSF